MSRTVGTASEYDFIFKLVLVGDSSVGKSNLLLRFTRNEFRLDTQSTIGVEFAYKQLVVEGKRIKTQVWDTAGQERFKTIIPQFYRGSEGALAVFDLTKSESFDHISTWIDEVYRHTPSDLPIVLVGNKSDLVNQRQVTRTQATDLAEKLNLSYIETSAFNATNVEQAFTLLITSIYHKKMPKQIDSSSLAPMDHSQAPTIPISSESTITVGGPIRLPNDKKSPSPKKSGCCVIS